MAANYILPQVLVFQEFNLVPTATLRPLPAHIAGPHAFLRRYSDADEQSLIDVGYYDPVEDQAYEWPGRPAGGSIDTTYTKVFIKDALLRYLDDPISSGSTITRVSGHSNRIRSATLSFADNGEDYPKSASLGDRGVLVGDVARVRAGDVDLWTYVKNFVGEVTSSSIASAEDDDANTTDSNVGASVEQTGGPENCIATAASAASYDGLADGDVTETYTITVTQSSVGGDHTTARLKIVSASGNDDVTSKIPSANGVATAIGIRGATVTFTSPECDSEEFEEGVTADDLIEGQVFELEVEQDFDAPTATSAGTYTGTKLVTYIVEVSRGGLYADDPQITVTTDLGIDVSGPTTVTAAASAVAVGSKGVTIAFDQEGLNKGDRYYITATPAGVGAYKTLVLGHDIPDDIEAGDEVSLQLFIRKDLEVEENRLSAPPEVNWEQGETEITLKSGITAYDDSWTVSGDPEALEVFSSTAAEYGQLFIEYRAWLSDLCNTVGSISDVSTLDDAISGELHPDNPLKWGVFKALSNSNGQAVKYTSVCDPDDADSWLDVLALLDGREDVYGLVPLTRNQTVLDAWAAHVESQSSPENGRWRVCFVSLPDVPLKAIVDETTSDDEEVVLATLADDPDTSGTQYTLLSVPGGNANFLENDVQPNDTVRFLYTTDGFGGESYSEFTVDDVISENTLRLFTGHNVAVSVPQKIEIWRNLNKTDRATEISLRAGAYASRRVRAVWPDVVYTAGEEQEGYHLCAALAGLASGVVSHQGMTNLEVTGFDDISRTTDLFSRTQLNIMAGAGAWIVTQDPNTGRVYSRHAVTTGSTDDVNEREEMIVRNVDAISYLFQDRFSPFIGISNVTPSFLEIVRAETESLIRFLTGNNFVQRLGSQLIDGTITDLRQHTLLRDRVVLAVELEVPVAANNIECHLVI